MFFSCDFNCECDRIELKNSFDDGNWKLQLKRIVPWFGLISSRQILAIIYATLHIVRIQNI